MKSVSSASRVAFLSSYALNRVSDSNVCYYGQRAPGMTLCEFNLSVWWENIEDLWSFTDNKVQFYFLFHGYDFTKYKD